jgi:membrane protease YdiL (CAAX protease family)
LPITTSGDPDPRPAVTREVLLAQGLVFAAAFLLLVLRWLVPAIGGYVQAGLALVLLGVPGLIARRRGLDLDSLGVTLGPWRRAVGWALAAGIVVFPPFLLGFHLVHTRLFGATADWTPAGLLRHDEALLDSPEAPCDPSGGAVRVWVDGPGLWVVSPIARPLEVRLEPVPSDPNDRLIPAGWLYRCGAGPFPERVRPAPSAEGRYLLPGGQPGGLWVPLGDTSRFQLRVSSNGAPVPLATGAWGEGTASIGVVESSRDGWWLLSFLIVHLGLVALPEEWFYRGYLQGRLDQRLGTPWRLGGAPLGWGVVLAAASFALLHPIHIPGAYRLLVFFPGLLFGWLVARTGGIGAAVVFHALCNLFQEVVSGMYRWSG